MRLLALLVGVVCVLLGGLWLLQGLGLVRLQPILCVADCRPVEAPSLTWTVVGFLVAAAGAGAIAYARNRRAR